MTPANRLRAAVQRRSRLLWPLFALFVVLAISWSSCAVYVRPGQWGVKQVVLGSGQGVHSDIFAPGVHFLTPGVERMHLFPADLQILEMSDAQVPSAHIPNLRTVPAIKIQTSEGYTVSVDVTVVYRVEDAYKVMTQIGPGRLYEDSVVIPRAEQTLRRTFGELDAEEFYRGDTREKASEQAQKLLQNELLPRGIAVTHVLVRQYRYDARYQAAIEQRKIQDQTVFKNQAEAQAAQAEAEKNRIVAEGAAAVDVEYARGNAEVQKLMSEAELYRRTRAADGELVVRLARAQGTELENKALRGLGSENMVGLKMAEALKGLDVIVLPSDGESGTNPLDLNQMLRRFDVRGQ
ncbi:MAG: SPFH domain-containing protein [Myxococcota bacterium]|jgi:regulator of protease activity HflC (stomatin/prohibitin superfamily)